MITKISLEDLLSKVKKDSLSLAAHTKELDANSVFVLLPPASFKEGLPTSCDVDSNTEVYIASALEQGVRHYVCTESQYSLLSNFAKAPIYVSIVKSTRISLGELAKSCYGVPKSSPLMIGITGTNGKTTSSFLLKQLLDSAGYNTGVLGTVYYAWNDTKIDSTLTTPGCLDLHKYLSKMINDKVTAVIMEVSSHALEQDRVAGLLFDGALFTNLTQDHLDYHLTMEEYYLAKSKLFKPSIQNGYLKDNGACAINVDDRFGKILHSELNKSVPYKLLKVLDFKSDHLEKDVLYGSIAEYSISGMKLKMDWQGDSWEIVTPLVGTFNAYNLLGVQAIALGLGIDRKYFKSLEKVSGIPGRLQRVLDIDKNVFIDYAHTPDALEKVLLALKSSGFSKIITVFGCGGDRDKSKRSLMGKVVDKLTDIAVITSDNPRNEDPESIISDIEKGIQGISKVYIEVDRKQAIAKALKLADSEDAILIAGKGHENYQILKDTKIPFDDYLVVQELCK